MNRRVSGRLLIVAAAILWGTTGTTQALAPIGATPLTISALRLALGGAGLVLVALARRELRRGAGWPVTATLVAGIAVAVFQVCFFTGVARTGVATGTLVTIGSSPIFAGVIGWLALREGPGRRWATATAAAIFGCVLLVGGSGGLNMEWLGAALALTAGLAYGVYTVACKRLLQLHPGSAVMAVVFGLAAVLLLPFLIEADLAWFATANGLLVIGHLGLITSTVSYLMFARGLRVTSPGSAATLTLAEPLTAALLGLVVLVNSSARYRGWAPRCSLAVS